MDAATFPFYVSSNEKTNNNKNNIYMKKAGITIIAVVAMALTMMSSCRISYSDDDAKKVTQIRKVKGFERVELGGSITVVYRQADSISVKVTGPEDYINKVVITSDGTTLNIDAKTDWTHFGHIDSGDVTVYITSPDIVMAQLDGSGDFLGRGHIDTDNMKIYLKGSGDVDFDDIICDRLQADLVGSGDVDLKNVECKNAELNLLGSGDVGAHVRNAATVKATLRGSGDIDASLENCGSVDANVLGSGDISFKGTAKHLNKAIEGSGDIDTSELKI